MSIRAKALQKLSQFYEDVTPLQQDETVALKNDAINVLLHSLPIFYSTNKSKLYTIPLTLNEWEVLLSVSQTVPPNAEQARKLLKDVISTYFLESPRQRISDVMYARFRLDSIRNPNEVLTYQLTKYLISICSKFPAMEQECEDLIDEYLANIKELYTSKPSSLFSLLGFMNAFVEINDAKNLIHFVWKRLSKLFTQGGFIQNVESILSVSTSFTNEAIVHYFNSGIEISGYLFLFLLSSIQVSFISSLIGLENGENLTDHLLEVQSKKYQITQYSKDISDLANIDHEFFKALDNNEEILKKIREFSLRFLISNSSNLDLSTDSRAKLYFNSLANFIDVLNLTLFAESSQSLQFNEFVKVAGDSMEKFLLSDLATEKLITSIVACGSLLNFFTEQLSEQLLRSFPLLVASEHIKTPAVVKLSKLFTIGLQPLNEDSIVSTIYSINNLLTSIDDNTSKNMIRERQLTLSSGNTVTLLNNQKPLKVDNYHLQSNDSFNHSTAGFHDNLFKNCVIAATTIAAHYKDQSINVLTISILTQKVTVVSKELDSIILKALAQLAPYTNSNEFQMILKFQKLTYGSALKNNDDALLKSILHAKTIMSRELLANRSGDDLYKLHLADLLDTIISSGDVDRPEHHRPHTEISRVANQIASYLEPLAALLPKPGQTPINISEDESTTTMFRNVWFNMTIHGFYYGSELVKTNYNNLLTIAYNSPPLASDFPANNKETSLEMNTILRRGSSNANVKQQKQLVMEYLNKNAVQARTLSSSKIMFVAAAALLETIRCEAGDCSKILLYLSEPSIESSSMDKAIISMSTAIIGKYVKLSQLKGSVLFNSKSIADQLNNLLLCLVHRNTTLQDVAFNCCDLFIRSIPSSLCHHKSLYSLLDMMTTVFDSIVSCETSRFEPCYEFMLKHLKKKILLPASKEWRTCTLAKLHKAAKEWVKFILNKANLDTKILLQSYISDIDQFDRVKSIEFGVSFAMQMAGLVIAADKELSRITYNGPEKPNTISGFIFQHSWRSKYLVDTAISSSPADIARDLENRTQFIRCKLDNGEKVPDKNVTDILDMAAALLILGNMEATSLLYEIVHIPFEVFTSSTMKNATNVWLTIMKERRDLAHVLLTDICYCWMKSIDLNIGLYSRKHDLISEEFQMMEYSPYNMAAINRDARIASQAMQPHGYIVKFFTSHFEGTLFQSNFLLKIFGKTVIYGLQSLKKASLHPFARMIRNEILLFGINVLDIDSKQNGMYVDKLSHAIVDGGLSWFKRPMSWPFGSNELKIKADLSTMLDLYSQLDRHSLIIKKFCPTEYSLLLYFLANEIQQVETWLSPLSKIEGANSNHLPEQLVATAFDKDPQLAVNIVKRYGTNRLNETLTSLITKNPYSCAGVKDALDYYLKGLDGRRGTDLHAIVYWCPVSPLKSINLFLPQWNANQYILQYSIFSLESHDVNLTFFYVPQIVQCLRYDHTGYVERLILDTARISVLFSHQIIWNMLANSYKGDEGIIEDDLKPTLDRVRKRMVKTFSKSHLDFYEREFGFFNEVTSISGKLKPYIKKSKAEKKQKIDEEMAKIIVKPNVYLPSNPDGVVIDINRTSGKPLQSHAKAPFMATFKIKKDALDPETGEKVSVEKWQGAIFKVGDDCRQDVLALQLVSMFRTIWSAIGLNVYVFPYRVTATAPGCGVIDVLPNSISRDMLGREAVNGLYEYFISKFGPESTIEFQKARSNFVKSLAGYSVISYLLQFKDRHNGNIMYDDQGHCLHIDFGFIFDIVPGGIKFEAVPFKLTKEMVKVMGGSNQTAAYHDFEELCIKAYLSARLHMNAIIDCIEPMLESGLPCFKGTRTIKNLENRFQPDKTDHEAAMFMKALIGKSFESVFTKGYDEFQRLTNGIPY